MKAFLFVFSIPFRDFCGSFLALGAGSRCCSLKFSVGLSLCAFLFVFSFFQESVSVSLMLRKLFLKVLIFLSFWPLTFHKWGSLLRKVFLFIFLGAGRRAALFLKSSLFVCVFCLCFLFFSGCCCSCVVACVQRCVSRVCVA